MALTTFSSRTSESHSGIPWIRRVLGDKAVSHILLGTWASDEEFERASQLFPEAQIRRNDPFWDRFLEWGWRGL
jgi:hypothetical protein